MGTTYEQDVVIWAEEQATLLRAGNLSAIDIEHIAEEIENVGKSEQRELVSRIVILLTHLLKWQFQPERRGSSWRKTIKIQRVDVMDCLTDAPSLKLKLHDPVWVGRVWDKAIVQAANEMEVGVELLPEFCTWSMNDQVLNHDFMPD